MSIFAETVFLQAHDAIDRARIDRLRAAICLRAANRYRAHGFVEAEARELRDHFFHANRADASLLEALNLRTKAKALRRQFAALAKTEPPPPSDVCMVAGE